MIPVTQGSEGCIVIVDMTFILCLSSVFLALKICSGEWCYQSQFSCNNTCSVPTFWKNLYSKCGGTSQSPINIVTRKVEYEPKLRGLIFEGHEDAINMTVENHGHSAHFSLPPSVRLHGGGLPATYKALQFHLHWGEGGGWGSEHSVDGERYPMELHVVHIKEKYSSLEQAVNDTQGVAALAFFFELSNVQNKHFDNIIEALGRVRYEGNKSEIQDFKLISLIPPSNKLSYYRYSGSLTTPTCDESVLWTVFHQTLPISRKQLVSVSEKLLFKTEEPMTGIYRPVQNLNGRKVFTSVPNHSSSFLPDITALFLCIFCILGQQKNFQ